MAARQDKRPPASPGKAANIVRYNRRCDAIKVRAELIGKDHLGPADKRPGQTITIPLPLAEPVRLIEDRKHIAKPRLTKHTKRLEQIAIDTIDQALIRLDRNIPQPKPLIRIPQLITLLEKYTLTRTRRARTLTNITGPKLDLALIARRRPPYPLDIDPEHLHHRNHLLRKLATPRKSSANLITPLNSATLHRTNLPFYACFSFAAVTIRSTLSIALRTRYILTPREDAIALWERRRTR